MATSGKAARAALLGQAANADPHLGTGVHPRHRRPV